MTHRARCLTLAVWILGAAGLDASAPPPPAADSRLVELAAEGETLLLLDHLDDDAAERAGAIAEELAVLARSGPIPDALEGGNLASLRGDLLLASGERRRAMATYLEDANVAGATRTRRAALYDGELYLPEIYRSETWGASETTYLLALDPQTGRVIERHLVPGLVRRLEVDDGALRVGYVFDYGGDFTSGSLRVLHGKLDRPVGATYGSNFLRRLNSMHAGWLLAVNFLYREDENGNRSFSLDFGSSEEPFDDAPNTYEDLERELEAAIHRDPTQPWHLFFLGQARWAQGDDPGAVISWEGLFFRDFSATPYYEFAWMTALFEHYGQHDWADRAYREALRRRQSLAQPMAVTTLLERLIDLPFVKKRPSATPPVRQDIERAYLWWRRTREISGISELDVFRARAWTKHFAVVGDHEREALERRYASEARAYPFFSSFLAGWSDYAWWLFAAAWSGFVTVLAAAWFRRSRFSRPRRLLSLLRRPGAALLLSFAGLALTFSLFSLGIAYVGATAELGFRAFDNPILETLPEARPRTAWRASRAAPLAEAVARHLAGDLEAARDLYRSLPEDPRAADNLRALEQGRLPPHQVPYEEVFGVRLRDLFSKWLREDVWRPTRQLRMLGSLDDIPGVYQVLAGLLLVSFFVLKVAFLDQDAERARARRWRPALAKAFCSSIPGVFDLRCGRALRGYALVTLFLLGIGPSLWVATADRPTPGPISKLLQLDTLRYDALLPTPPRLAPEEIDAYYRWTYFWSYPFFHAFWSVVGLALMVSLAGHFAKWHEIQASWGAEPEP